MKDLLASVMEAHGGLKRWHELRTGSATLVSGGELLDRKAPQSPEPRRMTISLHEEFASMKPFGGPDRRICSGRTAWRLKPPTEMSLRNGPTHAHPSGATI